ncbi:MAG TPA: CPBP family intramembrane metalloprotease [Verrucomicrobiales bacterium]|nr:CPBP family intramembrane metalloprotease [Verrucomicrobiales bacterium]
MEEPAHSLDPNSSDVSRSRWAIHLVILGAYPLVIGLLSFGVVSSGSEGGVTAPAEALLPPGTWQLFQALSFELVIFSAVFCLAWLFSRARSEHLFLQWRGVFSPVLLGLAYSLMLRILIPLVFLILVAVVMLLKGGFLDPDVIEKIRPKTETLIDFKAIANDPVYLWMNLTYMSFLVAGLREELWRAAMFGGIAVLWPKQFESPGGKTLAVLGVAVIFGLGHLSQGWGGVAQTTVLGVALGIILLIRKSMWDAVFAHGFFNATTLLLLYLVGRLKPDLLPG